MVGGGSKALAPRRRSPRKRAFEPDAEAALDALVRLGVVDLEGRLGSQLLLAFVRKERHNLDQSVELRANGAGTSPYGSSLYRCSATRYSGRHSKRFTLTTSVAMTTVESSSSEKLPASVAELINEPSPKVESTWPLK